MQRVLLIGGAGKQAAAATLPVVLDDERGDTELAAIADLTDPFAGRYSAPFAASMHEHDTAWIALGGDTAADLRALDAGMDRKPVDTVIVSCPPQFHYTYIQWALQRGLDVICDKPVVARVGQFGDPAATAMLRSDFASLLDSLERSRHRGGSGRPCHVFIPLMRRVTSPYTEMIEGLRDVFDLTRQSLTYMLACRSDGCYRFGEEHDRPGAHGYRSGLGALTQSAYHYLDFMACCVTQAPPASPVLESGMVNRTTVGDARRTPSSVPFRRVIGRTHDDVDDSAFVGDNAELDFQVTYRFRTPGVSIPDCQMLFSFVQRGCSRRVAPYYPEDATHDEGLTNDCVTVIHQGPLQSYHLLVAQDPTTEGRASLVRRLNPKLAAMLGQQVLTITDLQLPPNANAMKNRAIMRDLLDVTAGRRPAGLYARLDMREQRATAKLYALAIGAEQGLCTTSWNDR